jgi:hypothetical protein
VDEVSNAVPVSGFQALLKAEHVEPKSEVVQPGDKIEEAA